MTGCFETTVLPHREALTRAALALTRDQTEAQDLVQETLLRAWQRFSQLQTPAAAPLWLRRILRSVFLNRCESARARRAREEKLFPDTDGTVSDVVDLALRRVEADTVLAAVDRLPRDARYLVWLAHVEGLNYAEISARTRLSQPVIKSRLYRARQQVRAALAA
jgi:RNA polymerase sigma-70 factor (ECF subfamily)